MTLAIITGLIIIGIALILIRVVYVVWRTGKSQKSRGRAPRHVSTLIVLGSGGHTAEMLNLLSVLQKERFNPRFYTGDKEPETSQFIQIYRSREVGQSYVTSVWTTLVAMAHALWLMFRIRPEVVLCYSPGTCIPLCVIAFLFKILGIQWSSIFYVESIARVQRLSLSGLILYKLHISDQFFVQWPQLQKKCPRAHYVSCLM
ncbi:hypothetical protein UlMin_018861 [Ulmus minor]